MHMCRLYMHPYFRIVQELAGREDVKSKSNAVVCQSDVTALCGEAALFIPGFESNSPVVPTSSDIDRLVSGYRIIQTALLGNPAIVVHILYERFRRLSRGGRRLEICVTLDSKNKVEHKKH